MIFDTYIRPNKVTEIKNEDYHLRMAKALLNTLNTAQHRDMCIKSMVNWCFYKGNQWIFDDDLESFFMDDTGADRMRIKLVQNIVRPIVEYHRGNVIRMDFTTKVKSIGKQAISRRDTELGKLITMTEYSKKYPLFSEEINNRYPIGSSEGETEKIFYSKYSDKYEENMNLFCECISDEIELENIKNDLAIHFALDGIGVVKRDIVNAKIKYNVVSPMRFFFDSNAKKPDLSDAQFMGDWDFYSPMTLFESYQHLDLETKLAIEDASINNYRPGLHGYANYANNGMSLPVYKVYWVDGEYQTYACVSDKYGYPLFARINDGTEGGYTDKDIIEPFNDYYKKLLGTSKKKKIWVDNLRYAHIIPHEFLSGRNKPANNNDVVLEHGVYPYSDINAYGEQNITHVYKCMTWSYDKETGEVLSPVDSVIDPQRLINRVMSVTEGQINSARNSGYFYDVDASLEEDEMELQRKMNMGHPIGMKGKGNLQNSVVAYNNNIAASAPILMNVAKGIKEIADGIVGGGSALYGGGGAYRATGSVYEMQVNQGTLMQEPVYSAINRLLLQIKNDIVTIGKLVYIENERELVAKVGDEGYRIISLSKEYTNEDFRAVVERTAPKEQIIAEANQLLFTLLANQVIDEKRFALLFNNATMERIASAIREVVMEKEMIVARQTQTKNANDQIAVAERQVSREAASMEDDKNLMLALTEQLKK
jgi:hypothetical protein